MRRSPPPIVVTLVHGTVLLARFPRLLQVLTAIRNVFGRRTREPAWYEDRSPFVRRLRARLGSDVVVERFGWSGGNSVWERLCAAGADRDFASGRPGAARAATLRAHVADVARRYPAAAQVLAAHSHGGNVCLYALGDEGTRAAVAGLVCLSTPFVHARARADAGTLTSMLTLLGGLLYLAVFLAASQWVSARIPEPWDSVLFVSVFTAILMAGAVYWTIRQARARALRAWAESLNEPTPGPPTLVLLADGDEALLALKVAEGLNASARALWRAAFWLPDRAGALLPRLGRWRAVLYVAACAATLAILLATDAQSPWGPHGGHPWSVTLALKFLVASILAPGMLLVVAALALAAPSLAAMLVGYPALVFFRWLAFGWGGWIGVDMSAEACPMGTATVTRIALPPDARGLRHQPYNDPRTPEIVAEFVARVTAGAARQPG